MSRTCTPVNQAERQAAYRVRVRQERARMTNALIAIVTLLEDNDRPMAVTIRELAEKGLGI